MLPAFLQGELLIEDHLEPRKEQSHGPYDRWKVGQRCDHSERRARSFYPRGLQVSPLDHAGWQTGTFWRGRIRGGSESLSSICVAVLSVGTSNDHHAQVEAPGRDRLHVRRRSTENRRLGLLGGHRWLDRKSTRLNSSHRCISYAVFCLKKKKKKQNKKKHKKNKKEKQQHKRRQNQTKNNINILYRQKVSTLPSHTPHYYKTHIHNITAP